VDAGFATLTSSSSYYDNRLRRCRRYLVGPAVLRNPEPLLLRRLSALPAFTSITRPTSPFVGGAASGVRRRAAAGTTSSVASIGPESLLTDPRRCPDLQRGLICRGPLMPTTIMRARLQHLCRCDCGRNGTPIRRVVAGLISLQQHRHTRLPDRPSTASHPASDEPMAVPAACASSGSRMISPRRRSILCRGSVSDSGRTPWADDQRAGEVYRSHLWSSTLPTRFHRPARAYATFSGGFGTAGPTRSRSVHDQPCAGRLRALAETAALIPFQPDTAKNYEIGVKD